MAETVSQFEKRKQDHIDLALKEENQTTHLKALDKICLIHDALPDLNFDEIDISSTRLKQKTNTPFIVSSMTAGHYDAIAINARIAGACAQTGWAMGVGSQRRELNDKAAADEWKALRQKHPTLQLFGNIGIAQIINTEVSDIERLVDSLEAAAMQVHLNPLQECIQPEGTKDFKGGLKAIETLCAQLSVPVVIKETGCGISEATLTRLNNIGVSAVDVAGTGGTHWGRIEHGRTTAGSQFQSAGNSFKNWGIATGDCLMDARSLKLDYELWGSGGMRSGLDAAKCLALGASTIGFAKPILEAAMQSEAAIVHLMETLAYELKVALFCTGSENIIALKERHHAMF